MKKKSPITDLGAIGWIADQDGFELPPNAWTDVNNVRFRNGYLESMEGHVEVYSATRTVTTFAVQWIHQYSASATTKYMIQVGTTAAYAVDSVGAATDITGSALTSAIGDKITGGVQFGVLGVNNTVDVPQYWAGNLANNLATFTGWDANWRTKALRPFKNYWFALNVTKSGTGYPHLVKWSDAATPGSPPSSWDHTDTTKTAGESSLEGQDVIVDGLVYGDQLWIFKERSIHAASYIGAPLVFRFTRLPGDNGMLAANCAVETPKGVLFLSASDVILHNGQSWASVVDGRAREWLFDNMDVTYATRSFVVSNPEFKEVWICFPETGQSKCSKALIWNWETNALSKCDIPYLTHAAAMDMDMTAIDPWGWTFEAGVGGSPVDPVGAFEWGAGSDTWDEYDALLGKKRVNLFLVSPLQSGGNYYSTTMLADAGHVNMKEAMDVDADNYYFFAGYASRYGLHFDEDHMRYLVTEIWPRWGGDGVTNSYMPTLSFDATDSPETAPSGLTSGFGATENYSPQRYTAKESGRYFHLRFDLTADKPARIKSLAFNAEPLGQY